MAASWQLREAARRLLADESGTIYKDAPRRLALLYPSPYRVAMSSLGYQTIYRRLNGMPDLAADRAVLPDDPGAYRKAGEQLFTFEREEPVSRYPMIAFSVAYELEIAGLIECLELSGVPPLAADRSPRDPLVVAGGPLTFSNPAPLGPFVDVIVVGEGEELAVELCDIAAECGYDADAVCAAVAGKPGYYVPRVDGDKVPPVAQADDALLPARSQILTPHTELSGMFLTEAARGCSRGCTYCVMRRSTNGGMRRVPVDEILGGIPDDARRVGLVGAAVTDHPRIIDVVRGVVDAGRQVGISSLRADRLTDDLVALLAKGGYRTLTVAFDGASERLRQRIERKATEADIGRTCELARRHGLRTVKLYMMVGVPGETDDDITELIDSCRRLVKIHPRIALGIAPFVAKRNTPLDGEPFAGIKVVERRLERLRKELRGVALVRPTSARWAWVEYMLAQAGAQAGLAVYDAYRNGASFAAYKKAFADRGVEPTGPVARVPSTAEKIQLHKLRLAARRPS